ncbi:MAG: hypothetical protein ACOX81_09515 [Candidatus Heteroscillospira sp.]|jgi:hypothetical protein
MVKAKAIAKERGLRVVFFAGGSLQLRNGDYVRGLISGDRVFVRVDHPQFTADQILRHEVGHDKIRKGEIDLNAVRERLRKTYSDDEIENVCNMYAEAYGGTSMKPGEVFAELVCDSEEDMNIFSERESDEIGYQKFLEDTKTTTAETRNKSNPIRAPAETDMSRETRRAQRGRSIELETMENNRFERLRQFKGDLPAEWYAYTRGYFYVYSNESFMDYTVLMKAKITDGNRADIDRFMEELENGTFRSSETLDSWFATFRRGKGRDSWYRISAEKPGTVGRNDGVDGGTQRGENSGNSAKDSGTGEVNPTNGPDIRFSLKASDERRIQQNKAVSADVEIKFSLERNADFMEAARKKNASLGHLTEEQLEAAAVARQEIYNIFTDADIANALGLPPDKQGNTFIGNSSYGGTEENTTVCVRSMAVDTLMDAVAERLGRPLTVDDTLAISQEYWKYTDKPECLYCYVAIDRKAYREYLGDYLKQRDAVVHDIKGGMSKGEAYTKFLNGRKDTPQMKKRFDVWADAAKNGKPLISSRDLASTQRMTAGLAKGGNMAWQFKDAMAYAQSASWAKKRVGYVAYNNHILKWKQNRIDALNQHYGLRMYSFSDYSPAFILENMQMITDASVRGLKMLGYTKELDFVKIFAKTGMNINISVFGYADGNGGVAMDAMQGADWKEAQELREKYPNVGCTFVATNDAQVDWALNQDWIDVVIPFHIVRTGKNVADHFGWKNYTQMSHDIKAKAWVREADQTSIAPPEHQNNKELYLAALERNHLEPRFKEWLDHPNYMKLVNETRRSEGESVPVVPDFDVEAAKTSIEEMRKRGGYYVPIGGSQENMEYIADEIAGNIKGTKFSREANNKNPSDTGDINMSLEPKDRQTVREAYDKFLKQYGAIPAGEKPARKVQVPKKTADGRKVSQTVRTVMEAAATPDEALPDIEQLVTDGVFSYDVYTDKQAIADAQETVKAQGWAVTLSDWMQSMTRGEVSKKNTAMGWALYNNAVNSGDMETAMAVLSKMVQHQRSAAQALQATRILKSLSPESQLYQIQKSVDGMNAELKDKYKDKAPDLTIDPELAKKFMDAKDQTERDQAAKEIYRSVGEQMPSRFIDKWNAWRYLAMLGNPRTHVRNIVGNAGFMPVVMAKDMTAAAIEAAVGRVSGGRLNRTKGMGALSTRSGRELLRAAWDDFGKVKGAVMSDGKYSDFEHSNKDVEDGRTIFRFKPLEAVRKGNSNLLEAEDMWFSRPHYAYALAQYCKAHGITAEQLASGKAIKPARVYAIKEAQKATYRDTNTFSQMVSGWGRTNGSTGAKRVFNTAIEGILPFRKTPANILARGVEYSPIGMIKGLTYDLWRVKQGEISGAEAIDNISAGLTGTGLLALGVYLAAEGLIRGHGGDDEDEKKFEEMMGHQAYSLELPDGTSVTLDWLAPEMLPVFVGVNLWETANGKKEDITLSAILKAISNVSEPMLEMSVLQSLNDVFNAVGYASSNDMDALPTILASAATSYLTQGIPTLSGQFERSGQDMRMTTYTEKNAFLTSELQRTLGNISAKIPGWDFNQIPYIDAWGRKEYNGNLASRIGSNFLNPAYTDTIKTSEMEKELLRLFDELGEPSVFPDRANKYFTVDGERKDLTADEYVRYATIKGQESYKLITELVESKAYKKMDDKSKLKAIENAYDMANQNAKAAISSYEPDKWVVKAENADSLGLTTSEYLRLKNEYGAASIGAEGVYEVYEAGGDIETYLRLRDAASDMKADKDEDGKSISGSKKEKVLDYMDTMGLTDEEYEIYREALGYSK